MAAQEEITKKTVEDTEKSEDMDVKENEKENESADSAEKDSDPGDTPSDDEDIETALEKAREESKENFDRYLRVSAEFENYKKRATRDMGEFRKYANESIIKELLPVLDNLERAIDSSGKDTDTSVCIVEGVEMTHKEILKIFGKFDVEPVDALGKPFDPGFHQAVMREESDDHPENSVLKELQKGYTMHDRLIRPAMVVVSTLKSNNNKKEEK